MSLYDKLRKNEEKLSLVGLGYVGMPIAVAFAKKGINVIGYDLNKEKIDLYKSGVDPTKEVGNEVIKNMTVEFTADDQTLEGDIIVDSISTLELTLSGSSSFTGMINLTENADGGTAVDDNAVVTVEEGSTWTLTGDCTITSLTNNGTIDFNGHTITLADGTVLGE